MCKTHTQVKRIGTNPSHRETVPRVGSTRFSSDRKSRESQSNLIHEASSSQLKLLCVVNVPNNVSLYRGIGRLLHHLDSVPDLI